MSEKIVFRTLLGTLALILVAVYAIVVTRDNGASQRPAAQAVSADRILRFEWQKTPNPAPATLFQNDKGEQIGFAQFAGQVVLVNLWATWCAPCLEEMPALDRLQASMGGKDFKVVAISQDRDPNDARTWLKAHNLGALDIYHDANNALLESLNAPGLPVSVLLDRQGREIGRITGPADWSSPAAKALIEKALALDATN